MVLLYYLIDKQSLNMNMLKRLTLMALFRKTSGNPGSSGNCNATNKCAASNGSSLNLSDTLPTVLGDLKYCSGYSTGSSINTYSL